MTPEESDDSQTGFQEPGFSHFLDRNNRRFHTSGHTRSTPRDVKNCQHSHHPGPRSRGKAPLLTFCDIPVTPMRISLRDTSESLPPEARVTYWFYLGLSEVCLLSARNITVGKRKSLLAGTSYPWFIGLSCYSCQNLSHSESCCALFAKSTHSQP